MNRIADNMSKNDLVWYDENLIDNALDFIYN